MRVRLWLLVVGMVVAGMVQAVEGPRVEYSATMSMESAEGISQGPVYHTPMMERREIVQDGESMVMIIRHDKKVTWTLMPGSKMYMESEFPKEGRQDDLGAYKFDTTVVGPDTVNGLETTKTKIIMTGPDNVKMGGFMWATKEGIAVKLDAIAVEKKKKERFKMELQNLKVGKQDPSLFEIPKGYEKMDMANMGKMMMFGGGDDEDGKDEDNAPPEDKKPAEVKEKKKGFGLKDAWDLLK